MAGCAVKIVVALREGYKNEGSCAEKRIMIWRYRYLLPRCFLPDSVLPVYTDLQNNTDIMFRFRLFGIESTEVEVADM